MTHEEATKLCGLLSGMAAHGDGTANWGISDMLKALFPGHNFRVILDRSGEYTRWTLTVDDEDKRIHWVPIGGTCICCGKSAAELGVNERYDD